MSVKKRAQQTKKFAASAMLAALGVTFLYLASVFSVIDLSVTMLASFLMVFAVEELRGKYPILIYAVTGILALVLLPQKFVAVAYLLFFGYYPIFKVLLERLPRLLAWILKFALFNASLALILLICRLFLPEVEAEGYGVLLFAAGNAAFFLLDIVMTMLVRLYRLKYRKKLKLDRFFS